MKKIFFLLLTISFLFSCVPKTKYTELENKFINVSQENSELLKEIINLKYGDTILFKKAQNEFKLNNYERSKEYGNLLLNKHPDSDFVIKTLELLNNITKMETEKKLKEEKAEIDLKKKLDKYINEDHDIFDKTTTYSTKRNTKYILEQPFDYVSGGRAVTYQNLYRFIVELYIVQTDDSVKNLRLITKLEIFREGYLYPETFYPNFDQVQLWGDSGTIINNYSSDSPVSKTLVFSINKSNEMKFRFHFSEEFKAYHTYYLKKNYTYSFNKSQRMAFNEMVEKFKRLN